MQLRTVPLIVFALALSLLTACSSDGTATSGSAGAGAGAGAGSGAAGGAGGMGASGGAGGAGDAVCGDGTVQTGEECDDGNTDNTDGCLDDCTSLDLCAGFAFSVDAASTCVSTSPTTLSLDATAGAFLIVNGTDPTVLLDGVATAVASTAGCTLHATLPDISECTSITIDLPANLAAGSHTLNVTNATTASCTDEVTFDLGAPPEATSIAPSILCTDQVAAHTFDITGTGFAANTTVTIGTTAATTVTFVSNTQLTVTVPALATGTYDVTVSNGGDCMTTTAALAIVNEPPVPIFVSPSVVWNGVDTPVTIFGANVVIPVAEVGIRPTGTTDPPTSLTFNTAPGFQDRPVAIVPSGTTAGTYDVVMTDDSGCPATLDAALVVTDDTSLELVSITPSYASNVGYTAVTITANVTATSSGFVGLPQAYLTGNGLVTPALMESVSVNSPTSLSALIPPNLPDGVYSVVVVNPNGTIGILTDAMTIFSEDLPHIDSVTPNLISNTVASETITITGTSFAIGTVTLRCLDKAGTALMDQVLPVLTSSDTEITAVVDGTQADYSGGANCIVVVTNTNTAEAFYSAVVIVTSQTNLTGFVAGPDMTTPRRGLEALSGRASDAARFVYGVAGDDGTNTLATIDTLGVDIFGLPASTFTEQAYQLNTARTMIGAVAIGRFFYVVGGASSVAMPSSTLATVERAVVLDATFRPKKLDVALDPSLVDGLGQGIYYYRVAAIMDVIDPFNPGGETLPSDAFGVTLPTLAGGYTLQVTLSWDPVPGAVGYRIYRTTADAEPGTATLIADTTLALPAEVTCAATSCTDLGATPGVEEPLPIGSTGVWTTLTATLNVERQGAGVVAAVDPIDPDQIHIYALGGLDASDTVRADYEYLTITVATDGSQTTAASWVTGTQALAAGRWRLGAYSATPADSPNLSGTFVWAGSGSSADNTTIITNFEGAEVQAGGELLAFYDSGPANPQHAGYAAFSAGNFIYGLGGAPASGVPSGNSFAADHLSSPAGALGIGNNFNPGLSIPRVDVGATIKSGYFYTLGGTTTGNVVTASTEHVLY